MHWCSWSKAISSEKSALTRQNWRSEAMCLFLEKWKCYTAMWCLFSGQQQNCWFAQALLLQTWWTEWFQMSLWAVRDHCQRENTSAGFSSWSRKMLELTLGRACQLPLLFIARYNIGWGFSLSMISKLRPENGLSSNCTYLP